MGELLTKFWERWLSVDLGSEIMEEIIKWIREEALVRLQRLYEHIGRKSKYSTSMKASNNRNSFNQLLKNCFLSQLVDSHI